MNQPPIASPTAGKIGLKEFVILCAALMSVNALSIDPMLPALPEIGRSLGVAEPNDRQLVITAFLLGLGVGSLIFGILSDRFGRKKTLWISLALFIVSTIGCAVAETFTMLLASRAAAGFFAAASRVVTAGLVRDQFRGDEMARVMSLIYGIFILMPVIAPGFGQAILWVAPWRWIFWVLAGLGTTLTVWMLARMPETLRPENRLPINPSAIRATIRTIFVNRCSIGYMLASGLVMTALIGYLLSVQQIFYDIFHAPRIFPFAFAAMAGSMGVASLLNSRLVSRFGARRIGQGALCALIIMALLHLAVAVLFFENMATFILLQAATLTCISLTGSNFGAISMEPFAKGAGVASSFQAFLTSIVAGVLGTVIGQAFNGTTIPLSLGILLSGVIALLILWWAERGQMFVRYHRDELRDPKTIL